jgi:WD40 repeat protein
LAVITLPQLYQATAADLTKTWAEELKDVQLTTFDTLHKRTSKAYTDYQYPQPLPNGDVLALKSGIGDFVQFVTLTKGEELKTFVPGVMNDAGMLSVSGNKVVWSEYGFDPRWQVKNYSLIKSYDLEKKEYNVLTHKTRYSGAALSPDGSKIVTVESETSYKISVVVIDSEQGSVIKKFDNPENAFYSMARWSDDGKKIVSLKTLDNKRNVIMLDYESGNETVLVAGSEENIGHPVLIGKYLFFNSPISGIDNIYAYDLEQNVRYQVTSSQLWSL